MSATTVFGVPVTKCLVLLVGLGVFAVALPLLVAMAIAGLAVYVVSRAPRNVQATIVEPGVRHQRPLIN